MKILKIPVLGTWSGKLAIEDTESTEKNLKSQNSKFCLPVL